MDIAGRVNELAARASDQDLCFEERAELLLEARNLADTWVILQFHERFENEKWRLAEHARQESYQKQKAADWETHHPNWTGHKPNDPAELDTEVIARFGR